MLNRSSSARWLRLLAATLVLAGLAALLGSCLADGDSRPRAAAHQITSRRQLIGGPTALGEIGDYLLENDQIHVIVEDTGYASGSGLFGGSLIDADRVHQHGQHSVKGGSGQDSFGEFFPAYFLEMVDPETVEIINDGSDGNAAVVEVSGRGGEFVTMLRFINQAMVNSYDADLAQLVGGTPASSDGQPLVRFSVRYILEPGARHIRVESTLKNVSGASLDFPNQTIVSAVQSFLGVDLDGFSVPLGGVLGFGNLNKLFVPGIGYDLRWGLEDSYKNEINLPGFPGKVINFVASSNPSGTNYGFIAGEAAERNFVHNKPDIYGDQATDDMLMLFYAASFGGVLTHDMPGELADGQSYTFTNYVIVGDGDVASILDEAYAIREVDTQPVAGRIFDATSAAAVAKNTSLLIYRARADGSSGGCSVDGQDRAADKPAIYSQAFTNAGGYVNFRLPAGHYCYRTRADGRPLGGYVPFEVRDKPVYLRPTAESPATVEAHVVDAAGTPMPAKLMLVGTHDYHGDTLKRHFLYDLEAGQSWRTSDMIEDSADDPDTRRYLEAISYASADGIVDLKARPGTYDIYVSRGPEYELVRRQDVELLPGRRRRLNVELDHVVDTTDYVSGDFHMHARGSIDSGLSFDERVTSIAAEGVEAVVSSDHNHVSDYRPYIQRNHLQPWLTSTVGTELTTFEFGHFNAFPLDYDVGSVTGGSVPWQRLPPQQIFDELRSHGSISADDTIIQVNHPRDSILGYFGQYNVDPFSSEVALGFQEATGSDQLVSTLATSTGPAFLRDCTADGVSCRGDQDYESTFSWDFDAVEILNGKHLELLRHYRIPYAPNDGPDGWPDRVAGPIIESVCTDEYGDELDQFCQDNAIADDACTPPLDGHRTSDWCPFGRPELYARYPRGAILCDGDDAAYPGGLDDWYNLLNYPRQFVRGDPTDPADPVYRRFTATGNSDSHAAGKPEFTEPGSARNFIYTGQDDPRQVDDIDLVRALQGHHNIVSNGPFAFMRIGQARIGDQTSVSESTVDVDVVVRAADWVGAERFRLIANGEAADIDADASPTVYEFELDDDGQFETTVQLDLARDTWVVLEVEGDNSLFPVYPPQEIPSVNFESAIGSLAGSFGFGEPVAGLSPDETFPLTPFAFTNPIWIVHDQGSDTDGRFTPPAPPVPTCSGSTVEPNALHTRTGSRPHRNRPSRNRLDAVTVPFDVKPTAPAGLQAHPGDLRDVRTIFESWHSH